MRWRLPAAHKLKASPYFELCALRQVRQHGVSGSWATKWDSDSLSTHSNLAKGGHSESLTLHTAGSQCKGYL